MNIVIAGVGGQGIVLASKILAYAAAESYDDVRTGETIGMSQRGGSVVSFVRFGECDSPYFAKGQADLLIAFELCEAVRNLSYLKPLGTAIVNNFCINPVTVSLGTAKYDREKMIDFISENSKATFIEAEKIAKAAGSEKCVNTVMLGVAAACGALPISKEAFTLAIRKNVKEKFLDMNLKAFGTVKGLTDGHSENV
jgi:indolepyruvate ferredoxin oxidoreductase beta subunit